MNENAYANRAIAALQPRETFDGDRRFHRKDDPRFTPETESQWGVIILTTRDSGLLSESNYYVYEEKLKTIDPERESWEYTEYSHWAVGWVQGFIFRVKDENGLTPILLEMYDLYCKKEDYIILDEDDHSNRVTNAVYGLSWKVVKELYHNAHGKYPRSYAMAYEDSAFWYSAEEYVGAFE